MNRPLGEPLPLWRVGTLNVDFGTPAWKVRFWIVAAMRHCDVLLVQEAKNVHLRKILPKRLGVLQKRRSKAKAGSAVVWKKRRADCRNRRLKLGVAGVPGLLARYWAIATLLLMESTEPIACGSVHQIPMRSWRSMPRKYATYSQRVQRLVRRRVDRGRLVLIGGDKNKLVHTDPMGLAEAGLRIRGARIDGFAYSPELDAGRKVDVHPEIGPRGHPLVVLTLRVP